VSQQPLTKQQDQARLTEAARCAKCKRIWQTYSNNFCDEHSVSGWASGASSSKSSSEKPPKKSSKKRAATNRSPQPKKASIPTKTGAPELPTWKVGLWFFIGFSVLLLSCGAIGNLIPDSWAEEPVPTTVLKVKPKKFPNFINKTFGEAVAEIDEIDPSITIGYVDVVVEFGSDDEKIVVDQAPAVGATTTGVTYVCLAIVDKESIARERNYTFSNDCPKSQGDVLAEIATAWIPEGFVEIGNERTEGFAVAREGTLEDCTWEGVKGRCSRSRLASKNGCTNGAAIVVQWLNSLNQIVDTSIFSTSGRVQRGGIFEYVAFLPYSSWDKPVSTLLYQVRC